MRLFQYLKENGRRAVGIFQGDRDVPRELTSSSSVRQLAMAAASAQHTFAEHFANETLGKEIDYGRVIAEKRLLLPLDHEDPAHCVIGITGLTHLGSAQARAAMHEAVGKAELTDTLRMYKLGLDGGKPSPGSIGVQPEWAYKGDGDWAIAPEQPLELPAYANGGGEEGEVVGLYVIGAQGEVIRVGFCLGNEFSDHVLERSNYLYLAHSKLRRCSYGPEVLVGELPASISGTIRVIRGEATLWSGELLSGEENMAHSIRNLEYHHFKYSGFRRPGDVHVYFLGASILSYADGIVPRPGDRFEVACDLFGAPLRNEVVAGTPPDLQIVNL